MNPGREIDMMSGTKMFELWLLVVIALAAIFFFVSGWLSERKRRKENPAGPRQTYSEQVAGFFLMGCFYVAMTVCTIDIEMRVLCGAVTIVMFLAAVVLQKRVQRQMTDRPLDAASGAESHRPI